jgi:hypothetical protein
LWCSWDAEDGLMSRRVPVRPNRVSSRSSVDRTRTASRETTGVIFGSITDCSKTSHLGPSPWPSREDTVSTGGAKTVGMLMIGSNSTQAAGKDDLLEVDYPDGTNELYLYDPAFHEVVAHRDQRGAGTYYGYDGRPGTC